MGKLRVKGEYSSLLRPSYTFITNLFSFTLFTDLVSPGNCLHYSLSEIEELEQTVVWFLIILICVEYYFGLKFFTLLKEVERLSRLSISWSCSTFWDFFLIKHEVKSLQFKGGILSPGFSSKRVFHFFFFLHKINELYNISTKETNERPFIDDVICLIRNITKLIFYLCNWITPLVISDLLVFW